MQALTSAREHYRRQQRITVNGVLAVGRARRRGGRRRALVTLAAFQSAAVNEAQVALTQTLREQRIDAPPEASVATDGLVGRSAIAGTAANALGAVWSAPDTQFDRLVATELQDVGRAASRIGLTVRPAVQGYVRYLSAPSCARCAILAGRFYRWSTGFQRHPQCDCVMLPTNQAPAEDLISDPMQAFHSGQIQGMSKADRQAVIDGADLGRVVNVRLKKAGLTRAGRVYDRAGRPTPEGIYQLASDRDDAIRLLAKHGYIRT